MAQGRSSTTRLPSTRESRPALIGLAILLIVGGALASGYLALQAGNRSSFVMVQQGVAPGSAITEDDLGRVSLPQDYDGGVPASQASGVVGQSATVRLLPGTVLAPGMISKKSGVDPDQTQLTVPAPSGPFITNLQPGAQLALNISTGSDSGSGSPRESIFATLVSVNTSSGGGGLTGGSTSEASMVVTIDVSCLSVVSQGAQDQSIVPALIGDASNSAVMRTCRG